jgi:NADH dehydrogenase/NADH:ubiquinone oxidoreductase subunit G
MSEKVTLTIDGREIRAAAGGKLLWAALDNGIYIPNLCAVRERVRPAASCRLCFVEVEGSAAPVTACTQPVKDGLVVRTRSERVDRLVRSAFELLLSDHRLQCRECPANRSCGLQKIARERGLKLRLTRLKPLPKEAAIDESAAAFSFDRSRCVLCGRCIWVDREVAKVGAIGFTRRGLERTVTTFEDETLAESICNECGLCVHACPVGALYFKQPE